MGGIARSPNSDIGKLYSLRSLQCWILKSMQDWTVGLPILCLDYSLKSQWCIVISDCTSCSLFTSFSGQSRSIRCQTLDKSCSCVLKDSGILPVLLVLFYLKNQVLGFIWSWLAILFCFWGDEAMFNIPRRQNNPNIGEISNGKEMGLPLFYLLVVAYL